MRFQSHHTNTQKGDGRPETRGESLKRMVASFGSRWHLPPSPGPPPPRRGSHEPGTGGRTPPQGRTTHSATHPNPTRALTNGPYRAPPKPGRRTRRRRRYRRRRQRRPRPREPAPRPAMADAAAGDRQRKPPPCHRRRRTPDTPTRRTQYENTRTISKLVR